uniref:Uncharacterized protein n=1 Tax=Chromera velia CCMP2878 TaxID=1169474 RepID=A0A0G4HC04_9ALVE|eukprot:Cvel_26071.t1-p1 / transcript=Cvel_26071.t1 / gene=Cvel_26071 / organism=Chromera_velia_CCMP2878 / gene_product=Chlorophyll(ide) b reductase NOL, chloroplastic, putative / transcript_product=Chlorophyll(ide) b reductase NOL, chloroplastic, putative / location=Cvel_scaffold3043:1588-3454(+) / protein_length=342 / sequence_SO=supercontig / SO=protein_coding / is_pseudo=false
MRTLRAVVFLAAVAVSGVTFSFHSPSPPPLLSLRERRASKLCTRLAMSSGDLGVVITGAAGGVGFAYANEFLNRGHKVLICDVRDPSEAVRALAEKNAGTSVFGVQSDVSNAKDVKKLAETAKKLLGSVHYWINNAGVNGGRLALTEISAEQVEAVVKVNALGTLLCTREALRLMQSQEGVTGHIFNTVGSGVKGGGTPGYAAYGLTKRGIPQMTSSLVKELEEGVQGREKKATPGKVMVHTLSPGMVFTKLLLDDSTPELRKFPFGVLAAQPEEVAADLVPKILNTEKQGSSVEFLTLGKILWAFFRRFVLRQKSKYVDDNGNIIKYPGKEYDQLGVRKQF